MNNEETLIPPLSIEATPETTEAAASAPEYYIPQTTEALPAETVELILQPITVEDLNAAASDVAHADLFGSFLVCGTLVALYLFGGLHG